MKKIKTLCGVLALLCVGMMPVSAQNVLKFNADKKFKIVQFTDVHWVPGDSASEEAAERMNEVLDVEKPDLVIYTGGLASRRARHCLKLWNLLFPAVCLLP